MKRLYIPLPEAVGRESLLSNLLGKNRNSLSAAELAQVVARTEGFSGADVKNLCTEAAMGPMRQLAMSGNLDHCDEREIGDISYSHFEAALAAVRPSVAASDLVQYLEFNATFGAFQVE